MTSSAHITISPGKRVLITSSDDGDYTVRLPEIHPSTLVGALHDIRRFNGQGVSVLEHTVHVMELARALAQERQLPDHEVRLVVSMAAAHDVHEAILGDIASPIRVLVPELSSLETAVQKAVLQLLFPGRPAERLMRDVRHPIVRLADAAVAWIEHREIFDPRGAWDPLLCDVDSCVLDVAQRFTLDWLSPAKNASQTALVQRVVQVLA